MSFLAVQVQLAVGRGFSDEVFVEVHAEDTDIAIAIECVVRLVGILQLGSFEKTESALEFDVL